MPVTVISRTPYPAVRRAPQYDEAVRLSRGDHPAEGLPSVARCLVAERLKEWDLASLAADAQLVVSELVTNAVRHAIPRVAGDILLSLGREQCGIRIAVIDPWREFSLSAAPGALEEHGRGLSLIVGPLTGGRWGVEDVPGGKAVWARLAHL